MDGRTEASARELNRQRLAAGFDFGSTRSYRLQAILSVAMSMKIHAEGEIWTISPSAHSTNSNNPHPQYICALSRSLLNVVSAPRKRGYNVDIIIHLLHTSRIRSIYT